jgi:hypothetical protein
MKARTLIAAFAVVLGLSLASAASAGAVVPPNTTPAPTPVPTTTSSCPTVQSEPSSWLESSIGPANYQLSAPQSATAPGGLTVQTQALSFVAASSTFTINTEGCWGFYGVPVFTSNGDLLYWFTSSALSINGIYLVPENRSSPPELVVGSDGSLVAHGGDTLYDVVSPPNNNPSGPLSVVGTVDLATPRVFDPGSGHLLSFGANPQGPTVAGQPITGGDVFIFNTPNNACQTSARVAAYVPLPNEFSTSPSSGGAPTGEIDYNVTQASNCASNNSGGGGGSGGSWGVGASGCVTCHHTHALESADRPRAAGDLRRARAAGDPNQPLHLTVPDLYLGGLRIQNAFLDYDPSTDLWTGGGDLQLGGFALHAAPPPPNLGFGLFGNGAFKYGGAQLTLPPPGAPLFTGVNLTEIGVTFALHPTAFSGDATISAAGGEVTIHGGVLVVNADSNEPYTYQAGALPGVENLQTNTASDPITSFALGVSGTAELNAPGVGPVPLANGYAFYISPSYFEFAGNFSMSVASNAVQINGGVQGALDTGNGNYNIGGNINVCANFPSPVGSQCLGANALVSNLGIGACGDFLGWNPGFRYPWGGSLTLFLSGCDLGPLTVVVRPARDVRAAAAHAAAPVGFDLPAGIPSTSVTVTGSGGPPRVLITGPH